LEGAAADMTEEREEERKEIECDSDSEAANSSDSDSERRATESTTPLKTDDAEIKKNSGRYSTSNNTNNKTKTS